MPSYTDRNAGYLLLYKDGLIERTKNLTPEIQALVTTDVTVIDLSTMEIFNPTSGWEIIPSDAEEGDEEEDGGIEDEEEFESAESESDLNYDPFVIPTGAKRLFSPYIVWGFARGFK